MKILKLITIILCVMSMNRCKSQSKVNFDLSEEVLGNKTSIITSINSVKFNKIPLPIGENYDCLRSYSKELLTFYNIDFEDTLVPDSNYGRNSVTFNFSKKDSIIESISINTYTKKSSKKMLETLHNNFGKENYTGFEDVENKKQGNFNVKIWETDKNTFFLEYKLQEMHEEVTQTSYLVVVANSNKFILNYYASYFGYWEDYLLERNKKEDSNYTYQQFLIDENKKGNQVYSKYSQ